MAKAGFSSWFGAGSRASAQRLRGKPGAKQTGLTSDRLGGGKGVNVSRLEAFLFAKVAPDQTGHLPSVQRSRSPASDLAHLKR